MICLYRIALGHSEEGKGLMKEALEHSRAQSVTVSLPHLRWLVRHYNSRFGGLRVTMDLQKSNDGEDGRMLKELLSLKEVREFEVVLQGWGSPDGSDITTQLKVKEIAHVVKLLIDKYGTSFKIGKGAVEPGRYEMFFELTAGWEVPTAQVRERFRKGRAEFI